MSSAEWLGWRTSTPSIPSRGERRDALARRALRRMREDGEPAGADGSARSRRDTASRSLDDERGSPVAEVSVERVAEVDGPSFGDHRARDVRTPDRAARRLLEHRR